MSGSTNIFQGKEGEEKAVQFLKNKGYKIIDRNFRLKNGEVDIVATFKNVLIFVEVKTRSSKDFGTPLEAINYHKMKALVRVAQYYKMIHPKLPDQMRIDAISVQLNGFQEPIIEHIENISGF